MKIEKTKEIKETIKFIEKIVCDFCGKEVKGKETYDSDITSFSIEPGYGSKFDTEIFNIDICDSCLEKHILNKLNQDKYN